MIGTSSRILALIAATVAVNGCGKTMAGSSGSLDRTVVTGEPRGVQSSSGNGGSGDSVASDSSYTVAMGAYNQYLLNHMSPEQAHFLIESHKSLPGLRLAEDLKEPKQSASVAVGQVHRNDFIKVGENKQEREILMGALAAAIAKSNDRDGAVYNKDALDVLTEAANLDPVSFDSIAVGKPQNENQPGASRAGRMAELVAAVKIKRELREPNHNANQEAQDGNKSVPVTVSGTLTDDVQVLAK